MRWQCLQRPQDYTSHIALGLRSGSSVIHRQSLLYQHQTQLTIVKYVHFTDINAKTINMCPIELEKKLGEERCFDCSAGAFAGSADGMSEIFNIARSHNKFIVEDAAHSLR